MGIKDAYDEAVNVNGITHCIKIDNQSSRDDIKLLLISKGNRALRKEHYRR